MRLLGRVRPVDAAAREHQAATAMGSLACSQNGCVSPGGTACAYVDRRQRACATAWCPAHRMVVNGNVYCRRHTPVVVALLADPRPGTAPDVDNRALGLADWMGRELDQGVQALLVEMISLYRGAVLRGDPLAASQYVDRERRWCRRWLLVSGDATAHPLQVSVTVRESQDDTVILKVRSRVVAQTVPPWVADRVAGIRRPPEDDRRRREEFRARLLSAIRLGLARERQIDIAHRFDTPD